MVFTLVLTNPLVGFAEGEPSASPEFSNGAPGFYGSTWRKTPAALFEEPADDELPSQEDMDNDALQTPSDEEPPQVEHFETTTTVFAPAPRLKEIVIRKTSRDFKVTVNHINTEGKSGKWSIDGDEALTDTNGDGKPDMPANAVEELAGTDLSYWSWTSEGGLKVTFHTDTNGNTYWQFYRGTTFLGNIYDSDKDGIPDSGDN